LKHEKALYSKEKQKTIILSNSSPTVLIWRRGLVSPAFAGPFTAKPSTGRFCLALFESSIVFPPTKNHPCGLSASAWSAA